MSFLCLIFISIHLIIGLNITLVGGRGPFEGNILIDGIIPLCEEGFDLIDASVICGQMNMSYVSYITRNSKFGNTSQGLGMSLSCFGTEATISECIRRENIDCGVEQGAGVSCSNTPNSK